MSHNDMTVYEHIGELRKRIVISVSVFVIAVIGSFFLAEPLIVFLQKADEAKELTMNAFRLTDPIKVYMQFAFLIAFIITLPVILFQLWAFISPGLLEKERKVTLSYIPVSVLLFVGGIAFAYFILFPLVVEFMTSIANRLDINQVIGINEYFQFLFQLTIPFGVLFQLPVVVMFLTRLGIVSPAYLVKIRKYAYFVLVVIAAFITPPDLLSHLMVTFPLLLLYEVSIFISRISYKKVLEAEKLQELENKQS
ncbi:twin-arginine translocase subunit TatC [Cytobacillus sp. NCCP-133]|uniref:twin-arginine translocase subunit TatC n=1 Tax=Cytobacillus sp. NCCP-133 TaxID=766848 RepID=UPI00223203DA|nr:twin-arginine translocase subunit TatC [Cytobacillus sp. NCCP-133]GLB61970.1 Sec-independent protein translocase protein TatCy [Cytobacillus sp. NCCP-133]